MKRFALLLTAAIGPAPINTFAAPTLDDGDDRLNLRVLYAGKPDHARARDFIQFLDAHFVNPMATSYETITAEEAKDYDVIIFDWPSILPRDENGDVLRDNFRLQSPKQPSLPEDWDRPSIVIGGPGQNIAGMFRSKIDWL